MKSILKYPFFLALDISSPSDAWKFLQEHQLNIGGVKLGPKLILNAGWDFVTKASKIAPVFLDFKFYDIPSVTLSAVKQSFDLGASFVTVHASIGAEALSLIYDFEKEANKTRAFKVLAVSILTSFAEDKQLPHWKDGKIIDKVKCLANLVKQSGLKGFVCSPEDLKYLKPLYPEFFFVTPGIRLNSDLKKIENDDQNRILTPSEALQEGSDALVIGRPVYNNENPSNILKSIILDCKNK
ncbi:MAG: orotidine-5'-phosphate decarboxylase [Bdellovibrionales bacterium]|nr:orotidine-5'-phosphate decarboxylase [Bdellovibrionales bacterium]